MRIGTRPLFQSSFKENHAVHFFSILISSCLNKCSWHLLYRLLYRPVSVLYVACGEKVGQ